ncbi:hypothetical protein H2202_005932 [Exophiala xenobiotica]|nr:hypothetical protein H2202_005932 [Exophiala xenobiotica]
MEQTDTIEHAGMRGISPETQELIPFNTEGKQDGPPRQSPAYPRVLKALQNIYTTDMPQYRPLVNEAQKEIWGDVPFPPRSIDDIVEVESTFAVPE